MAFRHLDRLPHEGDTVNVEGILITILEMKEHRISKVRVARGQAAEEKTAEPAAGDALPGTDEAPPGEGEAAAAPSEPESAAAPEEITFVAEEGVAPVDAETTDEADETTEETEKRESVSR